MCVLMFTLKIRKYDCNTFQSFLSFTTADNTTANNLRWPRKCYQTTGMVRLPYGASRVVGLRWSDVVNSLEREHRSDGPLVNIVVNGFFSKRQLESAVGWFCGHCCVCFFILRSRDISLPRFLTYFTRDTGLSGVVVRGALCKIIND